MDGRFRKDFGGFLKRGRRDETPCGQRGLCDPKKKRLRHSRFTLLSHHPLVFLFKVPLFHLVAHKEICVAHLFDAYPTQHLPHDHFDMLIVDPHPLQSVNFLYLIHEVFRQRLFTQNVKNVMGVRGTLHEGLSGFDPIPFVDADVLSLLDEVFPGLSYIRGHQHLPLSFSIFTERDHAIDLANDGELLGLAGFEKLRHPRQASRNIFGLGRFPRDLGQYVTRSNGLPFLNIDVGTHRY